MTRLTGRITRQQLGKKLAKILLKIKHLLHGSGCSSVKQSWCFLLYRYTVAITGFSDELFSICVGWDCIALGDTILADGWEVQKTGAAVVTEERLLKGKVGLYRWGCFVLPSMTAEFELVDRSRAAKLLTFLLTGSTLVGEWSHCRAVVNPTIGYSGRA